MVPLLIDIFKFLFNEILMRKYEQLKKNYVNQIVYNKNNININKTNLFTLSTAVSLVDRLFLIIEDH